MSASPAEIAVTMPPPVTVAIDVADDRQLAWLVTVCVVASERLAVATNCAVPPMPGVAPETVTVDTVGAAGGVGEVGVGVDAAVGVDPPELPQAQKAVASTVALAIE
jgi:hypothetical protein